MRLVDADEAKKYLYEHLDDLHMIAAQNAIDEMPTIDAQPVKRGKWVELPKALNPNETPCQCSNCKHVISFYYGYPKSKFCDECGAKMDGDG